MRNRRQGASPTRALVVAAFLLLSWLAASAAAGSPAVISQVMIASIADGDFGLGMTFTDGTPVGEEDLPGTVIPPGTYQVDVSDTTTQGNFDLQGNGVSFETGLEQTVQTTWMVTFLPCSLYSYRNDQQSAGIEWFQTSFSATSTAACSPSALIVPTAPAAPSAPQKPIKITHQQLPPGTRLSAVGTVIHSVPSRGTIDGSVGAAGSLVLTFRGRSATKLLAGRYELSVVDRTTAHGLELVKPGGGHVALTGSRFVGKLKTSVVLSRGVWRAAVTGSPSRSLRLTVR